MQDCAYKIYELKSFSAEILDKFIHAVEINTRDPLVSVSYHSFSNFIFESCLKYVTLMTVHY
jgi:hypothetical protein